MAMKILIKTLFLVLFLFGILLGMLTANSLQDDALVSSKLEFSGDELKRVKRFVQLNNPPKFKAGQMVDSQISQQDLNLLLAYASQKVDKRWQKRISASVTLGDQQAYVLASVELPKNPLGSLNLGSLNMGRYLNLELLFESRVNKTPNSAAVLELKSLKIGDVSMPSFIVGVLANYLHKQLKNKLTQYSLLSQSIDNIEFENKKLRLRYVWGSQVFDVIKRI